MRSLLDLLALFSKLTPLDISAKNAAERKDFKQAEILRAQGARLEAIAFGVGLSGDTTYARQLLEQNPQCLQLPNALTLAFALNKHHISAIKFSHQFNADPNFIVLGAAISGNKSAAIYLQKCFNLPITFVVMGAILGGDTQWAEALRKSEEDKFGLRNITDLTQSMAYIAYLADEENYTKHLQGLFQFQGPSDTTQYAEYTRFLNQKFYSSKHANAQPIRTRPRLMPLKQPPQEKGKPTSPIKKKFTELPPLIQRAPRTQLKPKSPITRPRAHHRTGRFSHDQITLRNEIEKKLPSSNQAPTVRSIATQTTTHFFKLPPIANKKAGINFETEFDSEYDSSFSLSDSSFDLTRK